MRTIYVDIVVLVSLIQILIGSSYGLPYTSLGNQRIDNTSSPTDTVHITITSTIPSTTEEGTAIEANATTEEGTRIETNSTTEEGTTIGINATTEEGTTIETNATTGEGTTIETNSTTEEGTTIETNATTEEGTTITISSTTEEGAQARNCSTITCGDNASCEEDIEHVPSCVCLRHYDLNNTTLKCELKYKWVNYTTDLWNDTKLWMINGGAFDGKFVLIRQVYENGNKVPLHRLIFPFEEIRPFNAPDGKVIRIEVLLIEPGHYRWVPSSNGTVETNAIVGGSWLNDKLYICRHHEYSFASVMKSSLRQCFNAVEQKLVPNYDLLVYYEDNKNDDDYAS